MWLLRSPVFWEFVLWIVVPVLLTLLVMLSIMAVMDSKFLIKTVTTLGKWGAAISVWQGMEWVKGVF